MLKQKRPVLTERLVGSSKAPEPSITLSAVLAQEFAPATDLAAALHLHRDTLTRRAKADGVPRIVISRRVFFRSQAIRDWIARRESKPVRDKAGRNKRRGVGVR